MPTLSATEFALRAPVVIDAPTLDLGPRLWPAIAQAAGVTSIPADTVSAHAPCATSDHGLVAPGEYEIAVTLLKSTVKHATKLDLSVALFAKDGAVVAWSEDLSGTSKAKPTSSVSIYSPVAKEDLANIQRVLSLPKGKKAGKAAAARFAHTGRADAVALSPDARFLVALHGNTKPSRNARWADVVVWDVESGACRSVTTLEDNAHGLVVTGDRIYTAGTDLWVLDLDGNVVTRASSGGAGTRNGIAVASDGRVASVGMAPHPIVLWAPDGTVAGRWGIPDPLPPGGDLWMDAVSFAEDGAVLRVGQRDAGHAWTLDTADGAHERVEGRPSWLSPWTTATCEPDRVARAEGDEVVVRDRAGAEIARLATGLADAIHEVVRTSTGHLAVVQGHAVALWTDDLRLVHTPVAGTAKPSAAAAKSR